jgi:hypothetical protein
VTIRGSGRDVVATLADGEHVPRGTAVFVWRGKTDSGERAPDGVYRPEIHLARQHRTILLPNRIALDTHAPKVLDAKASRDTISPDGDHVGDSIRIAYRFNGPAHAALYLGSTRLVRTRGHQAKGTFSWQGIVDGEPLPAGTYVLYLGGIDLAGNVVPPGDRRLVVVRVRYIGLARDTIRVHKPGVRFGVGVDTDATSYTWRLDGGHGSSQERVLRLHAPNRPGTYTLVVGEGQHTARAKLVVGSAR